MVTVGAGALQFRGTLLRTWAQLVSGRNTETGRDLGEKNGWLIRAPSWPGEEGEGVHRVNTYKNDCAGDSSQGQGQQDLPPGFRSMFAVPVTEVSQEGRRGHFLTGGGDIQSIQ